MYSNRKTATRRTAKNSGRLVLAQPSLTPLFIASQSVPARDRGVFVPLKAEQVVFSTEYKRKADAVNTETGEITARKGEIAQSEKTYVQVTFVKDTEATRQLIDVMRNGRNKTVKAAAKKELLASAQLYYSFINPSSSVYGGTFSDVYYPCADSRTGSHTSHLDMINNLRQAAANVGGDVAGFLGHISANGDKLKEGGVGSHAERVMFFVELFNLDIAFKSYAKEGCVHAFSYVS